MKTIDLNIAGEEYEFAYSKDFRILKKREDYGTEFYPFTATAEWCLPCGHILKKAELVKVIKHKLGLDTI